MSKNRTPDSPRPRNGTAARKRERQKKMQMRLYVIVIILVVAVIFVILVFNVFFNIQNVDVEGSTNYTAEEIFKASGITVGDNMLREDIAKCSENITSTLIYIESAEVRKIYPSTIKITVEASVPFANVQMNGGYYLISRGGKILEKLTNPKSGIMTITGSEADITLEPGARFASIDENKNKDIYALLDAFSDHELDNITYIDITDRANVSFVYDSRITVELGVVSDLDYRLNFIAEILHNQLGTGVFGTLRLLPDNSAQFIDEAGIAENDRLFAQNYEAYEESLRLESEALAQETADSSDSGGQSEETQPAETEAPETQTAAPATVME
ncbi:MAG: cell division protein FtsQ/DivIB [Oscillospiraceae bacterium]